jgi:hypothetical protein
MLTLPTPVRRRVHLAACHHISAWKMLLHTSCLSCSFWAGGLGGLVGACCQRNGAPCGQTVERGGDGLTHR